MDDWLGIASAPIAAGSISGPVTVGAPAFPSEAFHGTFYTTPLQGALAATEALDAAAVVTDLISPAQLAAVEGADTAAVAADVVTSASFAVAEPPDTFAASALAIWNASLAATEVPDTAAFDVRATTDLTFGVTGNAAIAGASIGETPVAGPGVQPLTEARDGASVTVTVTTSATLAATEAQDATNVLVAVVTDASLAVTEARDTAQIASAILAPFVMAAVEAPDVASVTLEEYQLFYDDTETLFVPEELRTLVIIAPPDRSATYRSTMLVASENRIMYVPAKTFTAEDPNNTSLRSEPRLRAAA